MLDYKKYLYISPNIMPAAQDFLEVAKGKDSKNTFYEHRDLDILFIKLYYYKNTYAITNKEVNGKRVIDILCDYYCYNEPPKLMKSMEGYSDSGHIMLRKWRLKKRLHHEILRLKNFNIEDHNCDIHHLGYTFDNRLKSIVPLDDVTHGRVTKIYDPNINIVRNRTYIVESLDALNVLVQELSKTTIIDSDRSKQEGYIVVPNPIYNIVTDFQNKYGI